MYVTPLRERFERLKTVWYGQSYGPRDNLSSNSLTNYPRAINCTVTEGGRMRWWETNIGGAMRGRIIRLLRRGDKTVDELAEELGVTDNGVRSHLTVLEGA